jgi:hypothetical protein
LVDEWTAEKNSRVRFANPPIHSSNNPFAKSVFIRVHPWLKNLPNFMLKSHELLGFMSPALANDILTFIFESDKPAYKAALGAVAQAKHVRPVFLERQPRDARNAAMLTALTKPQLDAAAGAFIRAWLVKKHVAMLMDFLNALEIKNENGVVEDLPGAVDDAKLKAAVELLLGKYPHETVAVYLNAFNDMNAAGWANLKALLEGDPRLQLGNAA